MKRTKKSKSLKKNKGLSQFKNYKVNNTTAIIGGNNSQGEEEASATSRENLWKT